MNTFEKARNTFFQIIITSFNNLGEITSEMPCRSTYNIVHMDFPRIAEIDHKKAVIRG